MKGVIERFSQIKPKVLFVCDKYFYNGKEINIIERVPEILKKVSSIKYLVLINYIQVKNILKKNINLKMLPNFFGVTFKKLKLKK